MQILFKAKILRHIFLTVFGATLFLGLNYSTANTANANPTNPKDTLTIGLRLEPIHLDPSSSASATTDDIVYNNIYEGLTYINETGQAQPLLATKWTVSKNKKSYTFYLKNTVRFHNGKSFSAKDVVFTFQRIIAKKSENARKQLFMNIRSINILSPYKVKFTLHKKNANFAYDVGLPDAVILQKDSVKTLKTAPVGTGPFRMISRKKGHFITTQNFPEYHGKHPALKTVTYKFIENATTALSSLLSRQMDAFPIYNDSRNAKFISGNNRFTVAYGTTEGETLLAMNNASPLLKDIRIRRAINHAINKQDILTLQGLKNVKTIGSHLPPHHPAYIDLSAYYPYDPAKSSALLKQAGAYGKTIKFYAPAPYVDTAEIIASQLRKVGLKVQLQKVDWATWMSKVFTQKDYDISIVSHVEPNDYTIYGQDSYYFNYNSKKAQSILDKIKFASTTEQSYSALKRLQRHLAKDAVNVWLYQQQKIGVWNKKLTGFWKNSPIEGIPLRDVYWQK